MASKTASLLILAALVAAAACAGSATARDVPRAAKEEKDAVRRPETVQEGTVLIPGVGRHELGTHYRPDIGGLDHSIPAAAHGQFIPGADDTWVPNPGFEVPNPFRPAATTESP